MPSALPAGEPVPATGALPDAVRVTRPFGVYVHVPFCAVRCGYCDFNTYTATELGGGGSQAAYAGHAVAEVEHAARELGPDRPEVATVFFGGGTPTLLPADDLTRILSAIGTSFGLADGAEVTTEANPDSVTPEALSALRATGFTRISFGMQSAVPHVLHDHRHALHEGAGGGAAVGERVGHRVTCAGSCGSGRAAARPASPH